MKIAILGAGLAGLACAITLEKEGVDFTILEKNSEVDDRFINGEIFLNILNPPISDCISYLTQEFGIHLKPVGHIKELIVYSENERAEIKGNLGFNVVRGRTSQSISKQMQNQLNKTINFNSKYSYEDLLQEYTHIILATGDGAHSEELGNYKTHLTVSLCGMIVEGEFDQFKAMTWLNNNYAPQGYCYLIPISKKEANLVVAYPDYPENRQYDSAVLLKNLHKQVQLDIKQELKEVDNFQITNYKIGLCNTPRIGNTFFVGNCYGAIMPFLGFGQFSAIMTGVYSAYDICGKGKYENLVKELNKSFNDSLILRKGMEHLDNSKFDLIVKNLSGEVVHKIFNSKNVDYLNIVSHLLKPVIKLIDKH